MAVLASAARVHDEELRRFERWLVESGLPKQRIVKYLRFVTRFRFQGEIVKENDIRNGAKSALAQFDNFRRGRTGSREVVDLEARVREKGPPDPSSTERRRELRGDLPRVVVVATAEGKVRVDSPVSTLLKVVADHENPRPETEPAKGNP